MNPEPYTFQRANWKSFRVFYSILFFAFFISIFLLISRDISQFYKIFILSFYIVIMLLSIRFWAFLTRVTISPEGLIYSTPFRTKRVEWSSIKSSGVFVLYKNSREQLPAHRYSEKFYLKEKFIFLSLQSKYLPWLFSFFESGYFDFHYRAKAWELIEFYLGKKENKNFNFQ